MKLKYLLVVFSVAFLNDFVFADGEHDIKGMFPYMGFIYYPDESVVDTTGNRFFRGAVLIQKDWLVTSAVQISDNADDVGFPRKTLLARLGSVAIDSKFTLNEDDDEQEREVVKLVRPYNHSATQWWRTDITLMQTLLPFNMTAVVSSAPGHFTFNVNNEKPCHILIFARRGNSSEGRVLTQAFVDLLPPSITNCGSHFFEASMTCAVDSYENKNEPDNQINSCQGYKGGPLVCEGLVVGLQTYIDNCKAPHLYQLIAPWLKLIECATKNKCDHLECSDLCVITNKDSTLVLETSTFSTRETTSLQEMTINFTMTQDTTPDSTPDTVPITNKTAILETQTTIKETTEEAQITSEIASISTIVQKKVSQPVALASKKPTSNESTKASLKLVSDNSTSQNPWPKEKIPSIKSDDYECERNMTMEAQRDTRERTIKAYASRGVSSIATACVLQTVFCIFAPTTFF